MSLSTYEKNVKEASSQNLDKRFPNSSIEHARLLIKEIIKNADKEIWLLSTNFYSEFYISIKAEIEHFLADESHIFNVIVASNKNTFLKELSESFPQQFKVKQIDKEKFPKDRDSDEYVNYIVSDTNAYRYEYSEKDIERGIVEAIANFNNVQEANYLKNNFHTLLRAA